MIVNFNAVRSIYRFEMARAGRTLMQSIVSPVLSTALYFVVFGSAIGSRIQQVDGIEYGAFIVRTGQLRPVGEAALATAESASW